MGGTVEQRNWGVIDETKDKSELASRGQKAKSGQRSPDRPAIGQVLGHLEPSAGEMGGHQSRRRICNT